MQGYGEQRAAIPAFFALVYQENELLFGVRRIQIHKFPEIIVGGYFIVADVHQDLVGGYIKFRKHLLDSRTQFFFQFINIGSEEGYFRELVLDAIFPVIFPEFRDHGPDKFEGFCV